MDDPSEIEIGNKANNPIILQNFIKFNFFYWFLKTFVKIPNQKEKNIKAIFKLKTYNVLIIKINYIKLKIEYNLLCLLKILLNNENNKEINKPAPNYINNFTQKLYSFNPIKFNNFEFFQFYGSTMVIHTFWQIKIKIVWNDEANKIEFFIFACV